MWKGWAPFSLLFISCTDTLKIFIFPLYLTKAFLILFLLCNLGQASVIESKIERETLSTHIGPIIMKTDF